ncbi:MAG: 2-isopropylmalate synthase, partial [Ancrocorticia sp.]
MRTSGFANRQQNTSMPNGKYRPFLETNAVDLPDRMWPNNRITKAPRWLSTDLRDGNQALVEPMNPKQKRAMFDLLVRLGIKEIEVGFPAASAADFDFCRSLVADNAIPEDVTISVLTQARPEIIEKTVKAVDGMPRATVHLYNATAPVFRRVVFHNDKEATKQLAVAGAQEVLAGLEKRLSEATVAGFEYSPEIFVDTELDYALEVCESVMDVWQPGPDREIVINLPTTVERATPNVYADQIEYMSRNLTRREHVALSAHTHNDRGTGLASTELALLAGVDRVEGCLFGQGERTGNVDLVTLALNLFSQGIDPQLDISDIDHIVEVYEQCTSMVVPERTPYSGSLVYTAFSGSHQDAIKKGFVDRDERVAAAGGDENAVPWDVPYLPLDPKDLGRNYEAVVRVNSQS